MPSISKFIERMDYYCRVASVGYDWGARWEVYDGGSTDCSALVITCLREAGFDTGAATYTGNMSGELTARGWQRLWPDLANAQPGDILLNDANHVAAVLWGYGWDATVGQASIGETGGVYGNQPGDQTGWETNETGMYSYPWDCILRWPEGGGGSYDYDDEEDEMSVWGYKNESINGPKDAYALLTETRNAATDANARAERAEAKMQQILDAVNANKPLKASDVWGYRYVKKDDDGTERNTAPGGNAYNCMVQTNKQVVAANTQLAAMNEAVKALAEAKGVDPKQIASIVEKAVKKKLDSLEISVEVGKREQA